MVIVDLSAKGTITLPESVRRCLTNVQYLQLAETKKGLLLTPVDIQPARPPKG